MLMTYGIIFFFFILFGIIIFYILHTYVFPKKIEEISRMIDAGQTRLAIKKLQEILEKDIHDPYAHYLLAKAYLKENNPQYAIVEYRQVLKLGRFDDIIKELDVHRDLARLYIERKAMEDARKELLILTKIEPNNFENYFQLGEIFYNAGMLDKALAFFKKSISYNIKHDPSYFYLGQIFYRNSSWAEAKQMFVETLKIDPSNYKAHYFLGLVLRQQGDFEWAIKEFETAQKSDDLKVKCFLAKGSCYMEKGQLPKAVMEFERGLKFARRGNDTELNLRYYLADCHEKMRDVHAAIHQWEKIVEVNANFRDVREKLKNYSDFRQDDRIKDFLIAGLSQFEHLSRKMVEAMGYRVMDVDIISDTEIEMVVMETEGKWRNTRQSNRIVRVNRNTDTVQEGLLRRLHEGMRAKNANRIMIITSGDYSQSAVDFANTRPIDLFGKTELLDLLKKL